MKRNLNSKRFISYQKILSKSSKFVMKEFIINKFIKLKLEVDKTIIYVNNERFNQCKFLLIDIPIEETTSFEDIESIDDIAQKLHRPFKHENEKQHLIPSEVEFWGHCSNLQVWIENEYDTRLLYRNLAFPLLKRLTDIGDPVAKKKFKEEIAIRYASGHPTVMTYLGKNGYLTPIEFITYYERKYHESFNVEYNGIDVYGKRLTREFIYNPTQL